MVRRNDHRTRRGPATPNGRVVPERQTNQGDARRCGLATPRQEGQHASDVVAEFVHEVWSGPKSGKRSLAYYLAIGKTGISQD
jgi:hypothetical protein